MIDWSNLCPGVVPDIRVLVYSLPPLPHAVSEMGQHFDGVVGKPGSAWDRTFLASIRPLVP